MKTDLPLKTLFRHRAADLLVLTGDEGAIVEDVAPVEVPAAALRVDTVMRLRRRGEVYFRHVEFQARWHPGIERRFFEYNVQLTLRLKQPVLTTVLWVLPPGPRGEPVFRVVLAGCEVHGWRYESICLWKLPAEDALSGGPGLAALVPLLEGGGEREAIVRAARRIETVAPERDQPEMLAVLSALVGKRYTFEEILGLVGRHVMIESNFWNEAIRRGREQGLEEGLVKGHESGRAEGRAAGRAEGSIEEDRKLCLEMVREYHPHLLPKLKSRIEACSAHARLRNWILRAPRLSGAEFARLVRGRTR